MTAFEEEVREHLAEMLKRPMNEAERKLLDRALEERREAEGLIAAALVASGLTH